MKLPIADTPWFAAGLHFTCTACGNCCTGGPGYVWISEEEIRRLAAHLGMSVHEVKEQYCRRIQGRFSLRERRTAEGLYDCIFLQTVQSEDGTTRRMCRVYSVRPLQCRTWPFWPGNLASPKNWNFACQRCPGINRGRHWSREQIEALRDAEDWPEDAPGSK